MSGRCWQEGILVLQGEEEVKKNGIRFWWPKILRTGIDPKTILTKKELQYAVRRVAALAFQETADEAEAELATRRFMSPVERAGLQVLTASPEEFEACVKRLLKVQKDANHCQAPSMNFKSL
ncbi:hypothetical protein HF673_10965 [Acidithiobacillus thiooxidans]|jgi:hypothetical protein|uniref:hypothetical protein n=2 Tax=Acidithiobacillus thiooxidans TaxID=930 RepID=UPI0004E18977|nr:hypothetical protein [Acidithiobacillus thiooxidans]MBU2836273.1 hypothetical protein [Acidithiobacillus thiooxidans]